MTLSAGVAALQAGRAAEARAILERVTAVQPGDMQARLLLALACRTAGDAAGEERAVDAALGREPGNPRALIMKGDCRTAAGDEKGAVRFYERAVKTAAGKPVTADLRRDLDRAGAAAKAFNARVRAAIHERLGERARDPRLAEALAISAGEKEVFLQQPSLFYFPQLPQRQYYEREEFGWVGALEAETDAIREELVALLADGQDFRPYLTSEAGERRADHYGLLDNADWSTFHLWQNGAPVAAHVERCPRTYAALSRLPLCHMGPRAPQMMFSLLKAGARIPAHTGVINTRLICHLPLIVPPGCGFRVGNEVREWEVGKLLIFDDTIEHEAWNRSREDRVVLIFDIWRPELTQVQREGVAAMFEVIDG